VPSEPAAERGFHWPLFLPPKAGAIPSKIAPEKTKAVLK
jgi:hypothetical protein